MRFSPINFSKSGLAFFKASSVTPYLFSIPNESIYTSILKFFESEKIGLENKSLGFGFVYQTVDRTLSDDEVNSADQALRAVLTAQLPITLR